MAALLHYSMVASLDGYVVDADGSFDWAAPDDEVHGFFNDHERAIGTYLYGRRLYEVMSVWETMPLEGEPEVMHDYAQIWRAADKVVYSTTLEATSTPRTRLESRFDPVAVRDLKASAEADLSIGGPTLAASALAAGLVDRILLVVAPVLVGGGTPAFPAGVKLGLELRSERRFASGFVSLEYDVQA